MDPIDQAWGSSSTNQQNIQGDQSLSNNIDPIDEAWGQPQDISKAKSKIGSQAENGECQQFVEQAAYGKSGIFSSAMAAAQHYANQGQLQTDLSNMKPGNLIYFTDPSQPYGHVGIFEGNNKMISATYDGVQEDDLSKWIQKTGQKPLGYVNL